MNIPLKKLKSKEEILESAAQPDKRIIASDFDVYLNHNRLTYIKEHCSPADMEARFFMHIIPIDRRYLHGDHRKRGFQTLRGGLVFRIGRHGCAARIELPLYPIRYLRTGQYVRDEGRLWEGEAWIDPYSVGEERPEFPVAAGKRIIQSAFDVYLDGRQLVYHKGECGPADREPSFFLHVTPIDETVLPRDREHDGFDKLDFNTCTIERRLPAYAIRHIRTGQYVPGEGKLWQVEFSLDPARSSRGDESSAGPPAHPRSVFDVALDGQRLIYSKAECRPADLEARFFLHVVPVDETDLPSAGFHHGFENLDIRHPENFEINEFGCTTKRRLPAYAIRRSRTGQYIPGEGPLWEEEWAMAQHALGQD